MRILTILLTVIGLILIIINSTQIDFNNAFEGKSLVAIITITALLCAILLLQILRLSKKVTKQLKSKK